MSDRDPSAAEALNRAAKHGRRALAEALAGLAALLEAGARAAGSEHPAWLSESLRSLEDLGRFLQPEGDRRAADVLASVLEAVEEQVAHWERESVGDPDAGVVLRAFLALRELLWEFGLRPEVDDPPAEEKPRSFTRVAVDGGT